MKWKVAIALFLAACVVGFVYLLWWMEGGIRYRAPVNAPAPTTATVAGDEPQVLKGRASPREDDSGTSRMRGRASTIAHQ